MAAKRPLVFYNQEDEPAFFRPHVLRPSNASKVDNKLGFALRYAGQGINYVTDVLGKWTTNFIVAVAVGIMAYHVGVASAAVQQVNAEHTAPKAPAPTTTTTTH